MIDPAIHADWLALAIGNSRLHWAWVRCGQIQTTWDTVHHDAVVVRQLIGQGFDHMAEGVTLPQWCHAVPLYIASVVPEQTYIWQQYDQASVLSLANIPLSNVYPTLGVDRALALWGAMQRYGSPVLVIDGGTAMTFTGADADQRLGGGAILPGIRMLFQSLNRSTAALPTVLQSDDLPQRWATETEAAIRSGIIHTVIAGVNDFIQDWWQRYPESSIVFTGGDGNTLQTWIRQSIELDESATRWNRAAQIKWDVQLIFAGMLDVVRPDYPTAHRS